MTADPTPTPERPEPDEAVRLAAKIDQTDRIRNAYRGSTLGFSEWLDHEMELLQGSASFLATPPPVPAAPLDAIALGNAIDEHIADLLPDLRSDHRCDNGCADNLSAIYGEYTEAGAVPAAPGLDDPLDVNGPGRCSECGHAVRLVHRFPGGVEPEGYEPHPALARPPYPTPPEFAAMTPEQFSAFLDRIGHKPSLPEETS